MSRPAAFVRRLLAVLDPETAHAFAIRVLRTGLVRPTLPARDSRLGMRVAGLTFANPVGLAAGFDKNGEAPLQTLRLGFGFTEIGTVTPRPQPGNPRPRVFRLTAQGAIINRLGFNNTGHAPALRRLERLPAERAGPIGVNIGANRDSPDRIADYVLGVTRFAPVADYLTVNISSPNTPGLRDLQAGGNLERLLGAVLEARARASVRRPVFLKLSPDLGEAELDDIAALAGRTGELDGLTVANTTLARDGVGGARRARETGGMSGRPLFDRSTAMLAGLRMRVGPDMAIVGVGGIDTAEAAGDKIRAGADLVQLYTALVFEGSDLVQRLLTGLGMLVARENATTIADLRGSRVGEWVARTARRANSGRQSP